MVSAPHFSAKKFGAIFPIITSNHESTRQLIRTVAHQDLIDDQLDAQSRLKRHQPTALGMKGLIHLEALLTREAIARLKPQMALAMVGYDLFTPPMTLVKDGPGGTHSCIHLCENPVQFGLPCWHIMQSHLRLNDNTPLPAGFIHPRWFINDPVTSPNSNVTVFDDSTSHSRPEHYLAGSGHTLLTKEAVEAEAFHAQLGGEDGERYALQFRRAVQDLRRDFVPTPSQVPGTSSQTKLAFVPPPKLTKHQEELRKQAISRKMSRLLTSEELSEIDMKKRQRELKRKAAQATAPSSSAPARIASRSNSDLSPPRKKRTKRSTAPDPDRAPIPQETQDMDEWEMQWDRERLIDQGVLLDSSSSEEEPDFDGESMDLCKINTQDRDLLEGYDVRRLQERLQETGDTQETAIEID
jgi:hypothetical protein